MSVIINWRARSLRLGRVEFLRVFCCRNSVQSYFTAAWRWEGRWVCWIQWTGHPHSRSPRGPVLGGLQSDAPFSGARGEDANCAAQCVFLRWNHSVLPAIFVLISCADVRRTCKQDWIGGECLDPSERGCVVLCCVVHSSLLSAPMLRCSLLFCFHFARDCPPHVSCLLHTSQIIAR